MFTIRTKLIPIVVCLAFGLAACSSDSKSDGTTTVAVATTVVETTAAPDTTAVPDTTVPATNAPDTTVEEEAFDLVDISGEYLTDTSGMTLYIFTQDPVGTDASACYDACATTWPPVVIPEGDFLLSIPEGFDDISRDDGLGQLTYQGSPLYAYSGDSAPGDRNGDGVGGVWFAVALTG